MSAHAEVIPGDEEGRGPPGRGRVAAGRLGQEWLEPSGIADRMLRLTPESLTELWQVLDRKVEELTTRDAVDPRVVQVILLSAGVPLAPYTPPPGEHAAFPAEADENTS